MVKKIHEIRHINGVQPETGILTFTSYTSLPCTPTDANRRFPNKQQKT